MPYEIQTGNILLSVAPLLPWTTGSLGLRLAQRRHSGGLSE
jgi:hypothetical protein